MKRWMLLLIAATSVLAIGIAVLRSRDRAGETGDLPKLIDRADKLVVFQEPWDESAVRLRPLAGSLEHPA